MTTKPDTSKPREFWLDLDYFEVLEAVSLYGEKTCVHVIEYSAYAKAIKALKKIEEQDRMSYGGRPYREIAGDCLDELGEL